MHPNILHKQLIERSGAVSAHAVRSGEFDSSIPGTQTVPLQSIDYPPNARQRWLKMATGDVDRAGDQLVLAGMNAENFFKNPQFLWQHGASGSIINTIGKVLELKQSDNALYALVEYAPPEISPLADQILQLHDAGMLPANSIGFRPIEYEANDYGGCTFTEWELIECSKVELPMNPEAVDDARSFTLEEAAEWLLS
ncbi:MAG TPA: HK97 family phage prohead protease [Candidatus Kapabacteria bacterium]|jgi:HK97 family phage prohead protease